jgi:hypothetical protein
MKIKEILELNKEKKMPLIARDHLPIGEKKLYSILKEIGCEPPEQGKREWRYENVSETDLEKDITEFARVTATNKTKASKSNNVYASKMENKEYSKKDINDDKIGNNPSNSENESKGENKNMKDEIANMLKGIEPNKPEKRFKGFYLDADVADVIDSIKTGNKSEFVSKIIRAYLQENNLI